jgi:hypothetical protein
LASTDPIRCESPPRVLAFGTLASYLVIMLLAMAAGLWPEFVYQRPDVTPIAPLPLLRTLLIGQVGFFLLVWPGLLVGHPARGWLGGLLEAGVLLLISAPIYVMSFFLGDASLADLCRAVLTVLAVIPLGFVASRYIIRLPASVPAVVLVMLLLTLGYPAGLYILREFVLSTRSLPDAAATFGPFAYVWRQTSREITSLWPVPGAVAIAWLAFAFVGQMVLTIATPGNLHITPETD